MSIWFTADTHFGHKNIIKLANRPFKTVDEMDNYLITVWNSLVKPKDTIYHLGDFSFHNKKKTIEILQNLNGNIHLISGNHDNNQLLKLDRFKSVSDYKKLRWEKRKIILCHYPFRTWDNAHKGSWHLHGHCHGNLKQRHLRIYDVGIDNTNYAPIHIEDINTRMNEITNTPKQDHHII